MARLTNSTSKASASKSGKPASKIASKPVSASNNAKPLTVSFNADVKHISTSGKLAVFDGRKDGGPDLYLDLANISKAFGYLPESVTVEMTVKAHGKAVKNVLCVVPRTMQNRFEESKADFQDVYGMDIAAHMAECAKAEPARLAASDKGKGNAKAESAKPAQASQHGEVSSMADRMSKLESLMGKLAEKLL